MTGKTNCEYCVNYVYDEEYGSYECTVNLDQDEMSRFLAKAYESCPYFRFGDEYKTVRKQI